MRIKETAKFLGAVILISFFVSSRESKAIPLRGHNVVIGTAVDPAFLNEPGYAETISREFNMVEAENSMKWETIHPAKDVYDFREGDAIVKFAEQNGMVVRGHCLLWNLHVPEWLASESKINQVLHDHIDAVVGHYRGRVFAWDVVNEAFSNDGSLKASRWYDGETGTAYIARAFEWAHKADPSAKLFYNDFDAEVLNVKSDAIFAMFQDFKRRGIPIHGIGFQTHLNVDGLSIESFKANMARFAALGVEIHITELEVSVSKKSFPRQAAIYRAVVGACIAERACTAVQVWGFTDKHSWIKAGNGLLFDGDYKRKPAYAAVGQALSVAR